MKGFKITEKYLQEQKKAGKIRDYKVINLPKRIKVEDPKGRTVTRAYKKPTSPAKEWIEGNLLHWCQAKGFKLQEEYKFNPDRRWKADWYIEAINCLIEFEGGVFIQNTGHNSVRSYTKDLNKYNSACQLGFNLVRLNAINYKNLLTELNTYL